MVLLIYTVIPLPLYLCILIGVIYSCLFETLSRNRVAYGDVSHIQLVLHIGVHLLGVHLFILTQVSRFLPIASTAHRGPRPLHAFLFVELPLPPPAPPLLD